MKVSTNVRQSRAYQPAETVVKDTLAALGGRDDHLRGLILQTAALRDFDAALLSRLAGQPEDEGPALLEEVTLYLPAQQITQGTFRYDEFTRQALLEAAIAEDKQTPTRAARVAATYYRGQAEQATGAAQQRKPQLQALYYELLADPSEGCAAWKVAYDVVSGRQADLNSQSELIALALELWEQLAEVPGAQANIMFRKGWLAYDADDWQEAIRCFEQVIDQELSKSLPRQLYLQASVASPLLGGRHDLLLEGLTNLGLGYACLRQGILGRAAEHFEKSARLLEKLHPETAHPEKAKQPSGRLFRRDTQVAAGAERSETARVQHAIALSGLGEVYAEMGVKGQSMLHDLLPERERRLALARSSQQERALSLEDLAQARLQQEAERCYNEAQRIMDPIRSATGDRLRMQYLQARLYLEQGDWKGARVVLEQLRSLYLEAQPFLEREDWRSAYAALGFSPDEEDTQPEHKGANALLDDYRWLTAHHQSLSNCNKRLGRISMSLGDCCLAAARPPPDARPVPAAKPPVWPSPQALRQRAAGQMRSDLAQHVAARQQAQKQAVELTRPGRKPQPEQPRETALRRSYEDLSAAGTESDALRYYDEALALFGQVNMRDGMALVLLRQGDVAALHLDDPARREQALSLYAASLEEFQKLGEPYQTARSQERLQWLIDRIGELPAGDQSSPARGTESLPAFRQRAEGVLAHRMRFFRYRIARQLEGSLRWRHLLLAVLIGLVLATALCGWPLWKIIRWLGPLSASVSGAWWVLPFLLASFLVTLMINLAELFTATARLAVNAVPLSWFWFGQDQVAVDDMGLYQYDHTGQRKELIRWREVVEARSQMWEETVESETEQRGRTAVFGPEARQIIRFDSPLRGYWQLQGLVKEHLARTGNPHRWQEPQAVTLRLGRRSIFVLLFGFLTTAVAGAALLTLVFAVIRPLQRFGPSAFRAAGILCALAAAGIVVMGLRQEYYMTRSPRGLGPAVEMDKL